MISDKVLDTFSRTEFMKKIFFEFQDHDIEIMYIGSENRVSTMSTTPPSLARYFKINNLIEKIVEIEVAPDDQMMPQDYRYFQWNDEYNNVVIATFMKQRNRRGL